MMRRENGRVLVELSLADADKLCKLPREFLGTLAFPGLITKLLADRTVFEFSEDEFGRLYFAISAVAFAAGSRDEGVAWARLANAINEGNPDWTPYEVDEPAPHETGVKVE